MAEKKSLSDDEVRTLLDEEIRGAVGYSSSELSNQRKSALDAYHGQPYGDELEGRSSYVSRDVLEVIEWRMPSLMRVFTGGDNIVRFEPQGPEDEQAAQQATDYVNHVFQKENPGFQILYTWFKDALLQKNGFVKVYWEEYTTARTETYDELTEDEFAYILQGVAPEDILEHTAYPGKEGMLHAVKFRNRSAKAGKVCIDNVPPEEFLVNRYPVFPLQRNRFVCHRRKVTISELKEMGFEDVDDLTSDEDQDFNEERIARYSFDETDQGGDNPTSPENRYVWLAEAYLKIDVDGDGIAELRKVIVAGNRILENEEADSIPFVTLTPIPLPHKLFGMSEADLSMDLQLLKSTVFRQVLDNMYLANNGRYMALDGMVNIDDLLTSRPGGIVRVKTFDAVKPMQPPLLGAPAFNLLEYIDTIKENRTGISRAPLDPDAISNTATGANIYFQGAQARTELVARVFAETGVKDLFYLILETLQKHQDHSKVVRLRNEWVQMDPREWKNKFDMSVQVGLGTGSKETQMAALAEEAQFQLAALSGGLPIVTPENVYNLRMKALEAKNIKGGDLFYTHPTKMPPPPPQQSPDAIKLEIEKMKGEFKAGLQQMKDETKTGQMALKHEFDKEKEVLKAQITTGQQREALAVDLQKQREQQAAHAGEQDKARRHDSDSKVVDLLYERSQSEKEAQRSKDQEELKTILQMMQDNSKAQNEAMLEALKASLLADRETEVAERDAKGKVKKTVSRVRK